MLRYQLQTPLLTLNCVCATSVIERVCETSHHGGMSERERESTRNQRERERECLEVELVLGANVFGRRRRPSFECVKDVMMVIVCGCMPPVLLMMVGGGNDYWLIVYYSLRFSCD